MTTAQFFEKFDLFAGASDAVAKMRSLILELAVRGGLSRCGNNGWQELTVGSLCQEITPGFACSRSHQKPDGHVHLRTHNVSTLGTLNFDLLVQIDPKQVDKKKSSLRAGDVLFNNTNSQDLVGKTCLVDRDYDYAFSNHITRLRFKAEAEPGYVVLYLTSLRNSGYFSKLCTRWINQAAINTETLKKQLVPLPPLAEQKRIVAKVDELMALCDQLEAQQQERETKHTALAQATLARFAEAPTPTNLNLLFHSSFSTQPSDLRKTILTLAVQGKLVPQDPNDETLPKTFAGLKIQDETMENAPSGWACLAYRDLTTLVTSGSRGWKQYYSSQGAIFVRTQNIKTDRLILDDVAYVDLPASTEGKRSQILPSDILITITGANVTKAARIETSLPEAYVSQHIALTRPKWESMSPWLHLCFVSPTAARGELERLAYGDKPGLNLDNIRNLRFPIPPLAEQKRIVAKVEELMALVDALEAQQAAADQAATHLLDAVVSELSAAA